MPSHLSRPPLHAGLISEASAPDEFAATEHRAHKNSGCSARLGIQPLRRRLPAATRRVAPSTCVCVLGQWGGVRPRVIVPVTEPGSAQSSLPLFRARVVPTRWRPRRGLPSRRTVDIVGPTATRTPATEENTTQRSATGLQHRGGQMGGAGFLRDISFGTTAIACACNRSPARAWSPRSPKAIPAVSIGPVSASSRCDQCPCESQGRRFELREYGLG